MCEANHVGGRLWFRDMREVWRFLILTHEAEAGEGKQVRRRLEPCSAADGVSGTAGDCRLPRDLFPLCDIRGPKLMVMHDTVLASQFRQTHHFFSSVGFIFSAIRRVYVTALVVFTNERVAEPCKVT